MSLSSPAFRGASHFFLFVVICSFIATVLWSFVYFLGIRDVLNLPINWLLSVRLFFKNIRVNIFISKISIIGTSQCCNFNNYLCYSVCSSTVSMVCP